MQTVYFPVKSVRTKILHSLYLIIAVISLLIPIVSHAQLNPPTGLYRSDQGLEETWTASAADASQCKGRSIPGYSFVPNGYAEVTISGILICYGTQTLLNFDGTNEVRQNVPGVIYAFCGSRQLIRVAGKIVNPISHPAQGPYYSSATCYCHVYLDVWNGTACTRDGQSIAFLDNSNPSLLPAGVGGTSEQTFQVRVTNGANPVPGVAVSFSVDVTPNSGGHGHHDPARPQGALSGTQGTTDVNGEVKVAFKAPEVAGIHTIKAICSTCSNSPVTKEIQVRVPDLLPISPNAPKNADGTFVYALTSIDPTHQGNGQYHLTEQSRKNLRAMIEAFAAEGWGTVALNDASLYWGGRYDIGSNWRVPHAGHRDGREIDVSFTRAGNPVIVSKQKSFYDKFCNGKKVSFPSSLLHHYVKSPHFHVYLEKQTACWKSEK
jgi:hypothetical protein